MTASRCPRCNNDHIRKIGFAKQVQRYQCIHCKRIFTENTQYAATRAEALSISRKIWWESEAGKAYKVKLADDYIDSYTPTASYGACKQCKHVDWLGDMLCVKCSDWLLDHPTSEINWL